jgi:hypothetical protein
MDDTKSTKCQRCGLETSKPRRLYVGLVHETNLPSPLPLRPLGVSGGVLEICGECYGQWTAAVKTWFELGPQRTDPAFELEGDH